MIFLGADATAFGIPFLDISITLKTLSSLLSKSYLDDLMQPLPLERP